MDEEEIEICEEAASCYVVSVLVCVLFEIIALRRFIKLIKMQNYLS